ncbi:MAG: hypothetical protein RJA76_1269 [Bacteroidota bacterium]|jgi:hypothetical protein
MTFFKNNLLVIGLIICLFIFHLLIGNSLIVAFPPFGDDLGFIDLVRNISFNSFSFKEFYYPFNGGVHSNLLMKLCLLIQFKIFGIINYKSITLFLQLFVLGIAFIFLKYFEKQKWSTISKIVFFILFFCLKGNFDNYNVIGVLQHGAALLFLIVFSSYYAFIKKDLKIAFLVSNLALIFISSEAIGAILFLILTSLMLDSKHKYVYIFISLANILVFYLGIKYSSNLLQLPPTKYYFSISFFQGILIFVGGLFTNFKIASLLGFLYLSGMSLYFFKIPGSLKEKFKDEKMFSVMIFISLLFVGALVQVTRVDSPSVNHAFGTSVAVRFSSYHLYFLMLFLFLLLETKNKLLNYSLLLISIFNYGFNLFKSYSYLLLDRQRVLLDAYNFKTSQENTIYELDKNVAKNMVESGVMNFPDFTNLNLLKPNKSYVISETKYDNEFTYLVSNQLFESNIAKIYLDNNTTVLVMVYKNYNHTSNIKLLTSFVRRHNFTKIEVLE